MKIVVLVSLIVALTLLPAACSPQATPQITPTAEAAPKPAASPQVTAPTFPPAEDSWAKVIAAAKKEGKVTVYAVSLALLARRPLAEAFKAKYGISVEFVGGRGGELTEKIAVEQRAKARVADVFECGVGDQLQMKRLGLFEEPIKVPESLNLAAWRVDPWLIDPEHYVFMYGNYAVGPIINTNLVKPQEEPKSWFDLLEPRWKGKMVLDDPSVPGSGAKEFILVKNHLGGVDYWRKFALQEPRIMRDRAGALDMVVRGDYALMVGTYAFQAMAKIEAGAPIKFIWFKEGHKNSGLSLSLVKSAPHPNAAKLFVNWFISQEAQKLWSDSSKIPSTRVDVPQERVHPSLRWTPELKVIVLTLEDEAGAEKDYPLAAEIFKLK